MPVVEDIPIEIIYIVSGICGGIIIILFCIFLFFCCQPRPQAKTRDYEATSPNRRSQAITVSDSQSGSHKPFARVTPTHRAAFENPAAILSDAIYANPCASQRRPPTAPSYQDERKSPVVEYVEVTKDYHEIGVPPPAYSAQLSRRTLSATHLPPSPTASLSVRDLPLQFGQSRSLHNLPDNIPSSASPVSLTSPQKAKRVFYEVIV